MFVLWIDTRERRIIKMIFEIFNIEGKEIYYVGNFLSITESSRSFKHRMFTKIFSSKGAVC